MPEFVTVVFNETHENAVRRAKYDSNEFVQEPEELKLWRSRYGAIIECPDGKGQYQADRYTSFMFGSRVFDTLEGAQRHLAEY